jgi:hypothetical protein
MSRPIVVIGMGRSGTKLLTDALESLGVFMGVVQDMNDEALLFQRTNIELMEAAGGAWDNPEPVAEALADPSTRQDLAGKAAPQLTGRRALSYLGWPRLLRFGALNSQPGVWGWKDPRSTWTLPVWLELFPDLRIVHLLRHGVDVAASVRHIGESLGMDEEARRAGLRLGAYRWRGHKVRRPVARGRWVDEAARFDSIQPVIQLWARYVDQSRMHVRALGERAIELRFEDLAENPEPAFTSLARLCGLDPTAEQLANTAKLVDRSRSAAHERDPQLREMARRNEDLLARYGY